MTAPFHITLAQINPIVGDLNYNTDKIIKIIRESSHEKQLIVFPEMAVCGYPPEDLVLKPSFMDYVHKSVYRIADETKDKDVTVILPTPWREDKILYNAALVLQDGKIIHTQYKVHLPNYGVFDEERLFAAGPLPVPVKIYGHYIGILICEDMWFPDIAQRLSNEGAQMLISVNASPFDYKKQMIRRNLAVQRAQESGLPLIYVNQCGGQDELVFDGASFVVSAEGNILIEADHFAEDTHDTTWEMTGNDTFLCVTDPIFQEYDEQETLYQGLVTGLRDYVTKAGFSGVLLGLSGGVDSALCAAIAVDALGAKAVHCFMMPSEYTSQESLDDAKTVAKNLGVSYESISIANVAQMFEDNLAQHLREDTPSLTFENIQSRCRGLTIMALSNATGYMMLSTGNKSEMAVGYATLYGDMCGGFNPLKDVYKTQVYDICKWRNENKPHHGLGPDRKIIPDNILTKAPTAELKENQTDQDSLPPYEVLDEILECLIEEEMSVKDIVNKGHDEEIILDVWKLLDRAEYKRRQAPPGVKITTRSFGRDRRYPIINHFYRNIKTG